MSNETRSVGAALDGTIYVGFFSADGTQVRVAKSTDRGATFAPSVLVDTAGASATFAAASLSVNSAGDVFVAYIDSTSKVFFARSINAGASYSQPPGLGTTSSTIVGTRIATLGNYVYVCYMVAGGAAVVTSSNQGVSFGAPVSVGLPGASFGLFADQSNGDLIITSENASLNVRVSHDHGTTFDPVQQPGGTVFFSNWTFSSDASGRFLWVAGSNLASDNAYSIDLSNVTSVQRPAFLTTSTPNSRSLYAAGCGDVVDSVAGSWAAVHNFGATIGTTYAVGGSDQTTAVNPFSGDVLIAYRSGPNIKLDVYENEITGCGAHVSATLDDSHEFARLGQTLNYLVTVSDEFAPVDNVSVTLSTPGGALDFANASWECIGSDDSVMCPASSGSGASLGVVSLQPATSLIWIVSVPIHAAATDATVKLDVNATGATTASDVDTLVLFRAGFDISHSDGTQ